MFRWDNLRELYGDYSGCSSNLGIEISRLGANLAFPITNAQWTWLELQVRCFKWQVVCSLNGTQGCRKQQQGYLFQLNVVTPLKTSQQAHARLVSYTYILLRLT